MLEAVREERADQASGLRKLFRPRGLRVLPMASAREKARDPLPMARAFARAGERVLILDHGLGAAAPSRGGDLAAVLRGRASLESAAVRVAENVERLPVGSGFSLMRETGFTSEQLFLALRRLESAVDLVMVPTGDPNTVAELLAGCGEFLVLAGATAQGVASAYQLLKSIAGRGLRVRLAFDGVDRQTSAEDAFRRIENTAARFLGVVPLLGGWLPRESHDAARPGAGEGLAARQAADRLARAALHWQLAEFPRPLEMAAASESGWSIGEASDRWSGRPRGFARGDAGAEAQVVPARTVRRARTRREW